MKYLFILLLVASSASLFAQREVYDDSKGIKDRGYLGAGLTGLSFIGSNSSYGSYFSVGGMALAGYMATPNLSMGLGTEYTYSTYSDLGIKQHMYSLFPFVRYNIDQFFIQGDYDLYTIKQNAEIANVSAQIDRFFMGVGYHSGPTNVLIQYDLLWSSSSVFGSPLMIRFFFTFPQ